MKIISLTAENVKRLRAVEIKPTGEIVTIAGKNGQGKSSILDAIWWALAGTDHIQAEPIRKGEKKARIRLDLGEIIVERRVTPGGGSLFVENAEGARFSSPQKMLDQLLGALSFDPLAFTRMKPREQFDELRKVSKLDIDVEQIDGKNRADFAKRTDVNREAKAKRAQADAIVVARDLPADAVDEQALLDELQEAGDHNAQIETRKARRNDAQRDANDKKLEGARLRERAAQLRAEADQLDGRASAVLAEAAEIEKKIDNADALPQPINVADIRAKLEKAKQVNEQIARRVARQAIEREAVALEDQAKALTEAMAAREKVKADAIARAEMPIAGIGFGDGVVTFNDVPFEQASSAEQLRVSLCIAMAANPKLKVILIKDGSLLDSDSLAQIAGMAKDAGYQVWIERVDSTGKLGFVIEDGAVVSVDGELVKTPEPAAA